MVVRDWAWIELANTSVSFATLLLGASGIVWECAAPRWIAPGVIGLILVTLAAASLPASLVAWALLLAGLFLLACGARSASVGWQGGIGIAAAGLRWNVPLVIVLGCAIPFTLLTARLWSIAYRAVANKRL